MPEINTAHSQALIESLRRYKRTAVEAAIDAVKSPEVAAEFVRYLEQQAGADNKRAGDFSVSLACIVLGEAGITSAIPALLAIAQPAEVQAGSSSHAATFAAQRMAGPAFDGAMQWIESKPGSYRHSRIYDVLCAAIDADEQTRKRVADFCFARLNELLNVEPESEMEGSPAIVPARILVMFHDSRVIEPLEHLESGLGEYLLENFWKETDTSHRQQAWHALWQRVCRKWWMWHKDQEWRDDDFNDTEDESSDEDESSSEGLNDDEVDEESEWAEVDEYAYDDPRAYDLLTERFSTSPHAQGLPYPPAESAKKVRHFLRIADEYFIYGFAISEVDRFKEVLYKFVPREWVAPITEFENLPTLLEAFARFMHEAGHLRFLQSLLPALEAAKSELPDIASNPESWGSYKTIAMRGFDAGIDMDDPAAVETFVDEEREKEHAQAVQQARDAYKAAHTPFRREAPKTGRNDPCPCGSGTKYKKCCGK